MWCGTMRVEVVVHDNMTRNSYGLGDMVATELAVVIWSYGSSAAEQDKDRLG